MSDGNRQRPAIDLDDLERQLRAVAQPKAARTLPPESAPFAVKPVFSAPLPENEGFVPSEPETPAPPPKPAPRAPEYDPLAELARIAQSGSDWSAPPRAADPAAPAEAAAPAPAPAASAVDALEALLRMDPPVKAPPPSFAPLPPRRQPEPPVETTPVEQPMLDFAPPAAEPQQSGEGQFYAYTKAQAEAEPIFAPEGQLPPHDETFLDEEPQPRPRSGLKLALALAGVAALGVGGVMVWRGADGISGGSGPRTPPVIKASNEPAKVAPKNPGGMEVPNANQEIFAGSKNAAVPAAPSKVVTTEEQPVDVNQAARPAQPRVILPTGGSAATVPPAPPPPVSTVPRDSKQAAVPAAGQTNTAPAAPPAPQGGVPALGEPKKVRTVLVRPDGTVIDGTEPAKPPSMAAAPSVVPSSPVPTQTLPAAAAAPPASGAPLPAIVPASPAPAQTASTPVAPPAQAAADPAPQPAPAGTPLPPRRPALAAAPVAATDPQAAPAKPIPQAPAAPPPTAPAPAAPAAPVASVGNGDFAVQLAAPPTEQEAKSLATRLAQRFGDALAGQEPEIIRAEVNGKTLYRVRVMGLDRESANAMCNRIKSAQGSCFVAKN